MHFLFQTQEEGVMFDSNLSSFPNATELWAAASVEQMECAKSSRLRSPAFRKFTFRCEGGRCSWRVWNRTFQLVSEAERRESYDHSRATWLRIVADQRGHHDGKFPGDEKRLCRAVGSRSKG